MWVTNLSVYRSIIPKQVRIYFFEPWQPLHNPFPLLVNWWSLSVTPPFLPPMCFPRNSSICFSGVKTKWKSQAVTNYFWTVSVTQVWRWHEELLCSEVQQLSLEKALVNWVGRWTTFFPLMKHYFWQQMSNSGYPNIFLEMKKTNTASLR